MRGWISFVNIDEEDIMSGATAGFGRWSVLEGWKCDMYFALSVGA